MRVDERLRGNNEIDAAGVHAFLHGMLAPPLEPTTRTRTVSHLTPLTVHKAREAGASATVIVVMSRPSPAVLSRAS